jgi:hypothetical protein
MRSILTPDALGDHRRLMNDDRVVDWYYERATVAHNLRAQRQRQQIQHYL